MSTYYLFLDESGDHGLANINPHFPVFVLSGVLFECSAYETCRIAINEIKNKYWGNKEVIFHSSDIRKCQKEFQILFDLGIKKGFFDDITDIIVNQNYVIIADGIQKEQYIKKYGKLSNVYELCLSFIIERAVFFLDDIPGGKNLYIVIEERGKKENKQLQEHFDKVIARGTGFVNSERLRALNLKIEFRAKKKNINGLQLADLIAYPVARHVMEKDRANPAFDLLFPKFYHKRGKIYGLKTYP